MQQDVKFVGNDYSESGSQTEPPRIAWLTIEAYAQQCFTAGYVVGQLPSALVLASGRIPPRFWFPGCCAGWGILTLALACELHNPPLT